MRHTQLNASPSLDEAAVKEQIALLLPMYSDNQFLELTRDLYFDCRAIDELLPGQSRVLYKRLVASKPHLTMAQLNKLAREAPSVKEMRRSLESMRYKLAHPEEFKKKRRKKKAKGDI